MTAEPADAPPLRGPLAIIAGGGAAGRTQGATTFIRAHSTALTAGIGNPAVATAELAGAAGLSVLALAAPAIALVAIAVVLILALRLFRKFLKKADGLENRH